MTKTTQGLVIAVWLVTFGVCIGAYLNGSSHWAIAAAFNAFAAAVLASMSETKECAK